MRPLTDADLSAHMGEWIAVVEGKIVESSVDGCYVYESVKHLVGHQTIQLCKLPVL